MAMLDDVKLAMRITTEAYDSEIQDLIEASMLDLGIAGVETATPDKVVSTAIKTYCKMNFGNPSNYDNLKKSYDEQKAQLSNSSDYSDYSMVNGQ